MCCNPACLSKGARGSLSTYLCWAGIILLLAQLPQKGLPLLILDSRVHVFCQLIFGGKQPVIYSCVRGAYLTLSVRMAKVQKCAALVDFKV